MSIVTVGTLVLCMIIKPNLNPTPGESSQSQIIQKTAGVVKQTFTKKIIRDTKEARIAVHEDKDMLVVETLDGEAQITIGANACKRIVNPEEYEVIKKKNEANKTETPKKDKSLEESKESSAVDKKEISIEKPTQSDKEKAELLKELDK